MTPACHNYNMNMTMGDEFYVAVRRRLKKMAEDVLSEMAGAGEEDDVVVASTPSAQLQHQGEQVPETGFEFYSDGLLATAFLVSAIISAKR